MSLFGKILAVVNIFAAAAFFYLVAADWGERQKWTYAVFRQDLLMGGLPIDENIQEEDGTKVVNKISDKTVEDLFRGLGAAGVKTQVAEIQSIQNKLRGEIEGAANDQERRDKLRNILVPLVRIGKERDDLNARIDKDTLGDLLAKDFDGAFAEALKPPVKDQDPNVKRQAAIAHLLFNIAASRPEPTDLQRVVVVIGLKAFINEANEHADAARIMSQRLALILAEDQAAFENEHAQLVAELRLLALEDAERQKKLAEVRILKDNHKKLVVDRTRDLKDLQERIKKVQSATKDALDELGKQQRNLVNAQQAIVKLIEENQQLERKIRELEKVDP